MTETTGAEPSDQETGAPSENSATQETQDAATEAPSEYEFSDETSMEGHVEEKPAKRSAVLPIIAAFGGVLLLGSVAWWSLKGDSSFSLLPSINQTSGAPSAGALSSSPPAEEKPVALTPPASLSPPQEPAVAPKTDSSLQKDGVVESPLGVSSSAIPSPAEKLDQQDKSVDLIVQKAPAAPVAESALSVAPASSLPIVQPSGDSDRRLDALAARVDGLQKTLDLTTQELEKLRATRPSSPVQEAAGSPSTKALQERLDKLEQQVGAVNRPATSKEAAPPKETADTPAAAGPSEEAATAAPVEKPVSAVKQKTPRKIAHKAAKAASAEKPITTMTLRAVSSGHAWIGKSGESSELIEVIVGDKVAGIGTVKAIERHGDKWIVRGTKGTIQ